MLATSEADSELLPNWTKEVIGGVFASLSILLHPHLGSYAYGLMYRRENTKGRILKECLG